MLEKDYRVLKVALDDEHIMSKHEHDYLLKLRSAYTPQQLQILEQVMRGVGGADFNFAKFVHENQHKIIEYSRTDKVRVTDGSQEIQEDSNS